MVGYGKENAMISIDSVSNERIKSAVKIASSAKTRRQTGMFFLEGLRLCRDAAATGYEIDSFFVSRRAYEKFSEDADFIAEKALHSFIVSDLVENKLGVTQTSQGFYCLCRISDNFSIDDIDFSGKYIALENIQDPANLGAVARTAEALGISGIIAEGGCDIYSPKAQRAAMGSLLRLPVIRCESLSDTLSFLSEKGMKLYATTPENSAEKITVCDMSGGIVAVIGNEANGVSDEVFSLCKKVTIPMLGRAESLNASMAAAITMWEMMR